MEEDRDLRQATTIREYLDTAREAVGVFRWVWRAISTEESSKYISRMFLALIPMLFLQMGQPIAIGFIFGGLTAHNGGLTIFGIVALSLSIVLQKFGDRFQAISREWVFGLHSVSLDDCITEMFFEKSIGQHAQEAHLLSVSNIDKGRWKVLELQDAVLSEWIPVMTRLLLAFIFLCILSIRAGVVLGLVMLAYIVWSFYMNYRVNVECTPIERDQRALNRRRMERWDRVERVKISGKEKEETLEMSSIFAGIMRRDCSFWIWFIKQGTNRSMVNMLGFMLTIGYGSWLVWTHVWTIGFLYPLMAWTSRVSDDIWQFGSIERKIHTNMPPVKSMIEALELEPAINDLPDALELDHASPHSIEFADLSHAYPAEAEEDSPPALIRVSFRIEEGEKVALLGPSGAGKTTVMKKLLRFDDPTSGAVLIDGIDLRAISQASWRRGIGYIPQQAQVFDGSIRYNLTYALGPEERKLVTDEELWHMMQLLKIDFGKRLTNGLDTVVGKNGIKLSGGQAQRLMIGAAVMKNPWLLVVDEATSSLDSTTERQVQAGLAEVLSGTTTSALIVAHRLSTVRNLCTKFVVLKPASEVRNGDSQVEAIASSFEELYELSPTFRQLADDQGVVCSIAA
ncbi:MAG: hypothetical protein JWN50_83 [Parcubacteria group bacterium]|nr:hypothetical protein [Parcubacteria group bacterium]